MTDPTHPDEDLLARLRSVAGLVDPVPADVLLAARSAIAYRDLDAQLADLVEEHRVAGGVRGDAEPWFTFESGDVVIELGVRGPADDRTVVGQVDGADVATVTITQMGGAHPCDVDELGRFSARVDRGPVRIEVTLGDGVRLTTGWVLPS